MPVNSTWIIRAISVANSQSSDNLNHLVDDARRCFGRFSSAQGWDLPHRPSLVSMRPGPGPSARSGGLLYPPVCRRAVEALHASAGRHSSRQLLRNMNSSDSPFAEMILAILNYRPIGYKRRPIGQATPGGGFAQPSKPGGAEWFGRVAARWSE